MMGMLARFCLYGFLKNLRFYEPFFLLILLEKGLSFFEVGLLLAVREVTVILLEIPSGAFADLCGRRRSLVLSFVAYLLSFLGFGLLEGLLPLMGAMLFYAFGETFRTGTHKALIFAWLREEGREEERTRIYGTTRSWSKLGSAASALLAAALVFALDDYGNVLYYSMAPCLLSILNVATYPRALDGPRGRAPSLRQILHLTGEVLHSAVKRPRLRRLMLESMGFDGILHAVKDYLQPALVVAASAWLTGAWVHEDWTDIQKTALLVGPVYLGLFLLAAFASRRSYRLVDFCGGEEPGARLLWGLNTLLFSSLCVAGLMRSSVALILCFVVLHVLHNLWRPLLIGRLHPQTEPEQSATLLSVESLSHRLATMLVAPALGLAVDAVTRHGPGDPLWPVGAIGAGVSLVMLVTGLRLPRTSRVAAADRQPRPR